MMASSEKSPPNEKVSHPHPFRRALLRGLGVVIPPLLTIVIFLWVGSSINTYVLQPVKWGAREVLAHAPWIYDVRTVPNGPEVAETREFGDEVYHVLPSSDRLVDRTYVPLPVYRSVANHLTGNETMPSTGIGVYRHYVERQWLRPQIVVPVFLCVFILVVYLLGKFLAAGVGRFAHGHFESLIHRLPLIRNVYGSVKQVTDFVFSESDVEYTRVVAIEYPRKGIWSLGMVTGESMLDIRSAANEPVLSVLIPTSPLPMTGYTVTVKKSEAIDLNLTIDQALQFCVSCGVVVAPQQLQKHLDTESPLALPENPPRDATSGESSAETA